MTNHNGILIQNIYHMLAYALPALAGRGYTKIASENCNLKLNSKGLGYFS